LTAQPKRLIEVSLPLKAIYTQSAREESIRHGYISTLNIWWARRPLKCKSTASLTILTRPVNHADRGEVCRYGE
jgi:adenine-specific DNA methylase